VSLPEARARAPPLQRDLGELVARHRRRFGWYDTLVEEQDAQDVTGLADLPILDERLLLDHYYTAVHRDFSDALAYKTSGTSRGQRKTILYSPDDHASYCEQRAQLFAGFLGDLPPGRVAVSDVGTGHAAASARTIFREIGLKPREIDFRRPIREHVALLNDARPDVLFTMPVILDQLLACRDRLDARPRKVIVVGDVAPANWRRHVAQAFDIGVDDVLDIVGSIEVGAIAYHSAATGLYHFHDHIVPEVVDPGVMLPECRHTLAADQGILLLTSFAREYFPAVRYATNDVVRGLRRIRWQGKSVFVCDRFEGRFAGDVKHGERLSSYDICAAVNEVFPGCPFEVIENGGIEIRIATERVTPDQTAVIADFLMAASPDVSEMVKAGLVRPIAISAIALDELRSSRGKRIFRMGDR
jgi:phenylacetate-coenzyme A ligase PaaK-like adenylate-forming protein